MIDGGPEGGIFPHEASQGLAHVVRSLSIRGLDGERDDGGRHVHGAHGPVQRAVREGIPRRTVDTEQSHDIARSGVVDVLHLVGMHAHQPSHLDPHPGPAVHDRAALGDPPLVHAQIGELTVAPILELEGQRHQRLLGVALDHHDLLVVVEIHGRVLDLCRIGEVEIHRVQERLYPLVLVGRAQEDRRQLHGEDPLAGRPNHQILGDALLEDGLHQVVAEHGDRVQQLCARRLGVDEHGLGDLLRDHLLPLATLEVEGLHLDEIHYALKVSLEADGELEHHRVVAELLAQLPGHAPGIGARAVQLVDEGDTRNAVAPHLTIHGQGLRLDTRHAAQNQDRTVEHTQCAFDLDGEVDVAGRVDDIDVRTAPGAVGGSRRDGDAALALELHGVHGGANFVLAAHLVNGADLSGVVEDALGERRLPGVDMGTDADVSDPGQIGGHTRLVVGSSPGPDPTPAVVSVPLDAMTGRCQMKGWRRTLASHRTLGDPFHLTLARHPSNRIDRASLPAGNTPPPTAWQLTHIVAEARTRTEGSQIGTSERSPTSPPGRAGTP